MNISIIKAENTLFDFANKNKDVDFTDVCEWFYKELSLKSDDDLNNNNFSRDEISLGLEDFKRMLINKKGESE